jgi:FixJ family two-component response regulator
MIHVVEDDLPVREALGRLLRSADMEARLYGSAREFLVQPWRDHHGCIIIDVRLPDIGGLEFQEQLGQLGILLPTIIMTGYGDIPMSVRAMKGGAMDFLTKPFCDDEMLRSVEAALARDQARQESAHILRALQGRLESLSKREREVLILVASGRLNKQIAGDLGLSEVTVKIHRGKVMRKMGVRSLAELVRNAETLGL